jgi:hypothetical protein
MASALFGLAFDVVNVGARREIAFGLGLGWVDR